MDIEAIREFYLREHTALKSRPRVPAAPGSPNLVLGLAMNLGKADIEIFVNSLRATGYNDEIALFCTHADPDMLDFCRRKSVTLIRAMNLLHSHWHGTLMRFLHYYEFIMSRMAGGRSYNRVMMSDVTDVVFQINPFKIPAPDRLVVFDEGDVVIGDCPLNSGWIKYAYGTDTFDELKGKPIYCSGTTMGPVRDVLEYMLRMMLAATNADPENLKFHGIDQGIHNYMIHNDWLPDSFHSKNGDIVFTMYYYMKNCGKLFYNNSGQLTDDTGRVIPVLHQYNREPNLRARYREAFAARP